MSTKLAKKAFNSFLAPPRSKADPGAGVVSGGGEDGRESAAAKKRRRTRDPSRVAADGLPAVRSGLKKAKLDKKFQGSNLAVRERKRTQAPAPSALGEWNF
ncbi:MAG: hypothetical protein BJ554DRAFT_175 [Olpidium bornovanus]|uniref:Uncharacterized protein n=1 Tax=Olpidium bornovanus TaxID=278681 RepID=A0A8H7ZUJ7_9FUNG|nr:MAG: hypothetical protein BJ554DRAFT_175 [Olpidium bornovanus]